MKQILIILMLLLIPVTPVLAQSTGNKAPERFTRTILPEVDQSQFTSNSDCRYMITRFEDIYFQTQTKTELGKIKRFDESIQKLKTEKNEFLGLDFKNLSRNDVLGCAIITGRIKMFYLSIFLAYTLNMLSIIAGSISMLFIILGGYKYVIGSLTQSTDDAKKTIINAIIGLLVSTGAWILVNIVLAIISS